MANKTEIKKFLERKALDCVGKLNLEREEKIREATQTFMAQNKDEIDKIRLLITDIDRTLGKMVSNIKANNTAILNEAYYRNPVSLSNELYSCFASSEIGKKFVISECEKIRSQYKQIIKDAKAEYERLIAVTKTMDAKDGIALLERLGFDVTEIALKKEVTTLSTCIDASKLFIN